VIGRLVVEKVIRGRRDVGRVKRHFEGESRERAFIRRREVKGSLIMIDPRKKKEDVRPLATPKKRDGITLASLP